MSDNKANLKSTIKSDQFKGRFRLTVMNGKDGNSWKQYKLKSVTQDDLDVLRPFENQVFESRSGHELQLKMCDPYARPERFWVSLGFDDRPTLDEDL